MNKILSDGRRKSRSVWSASGLPCSFYVSASHSRCLPAAAQSRSADLQGAILKWWKRYLGMTVLGLTLTASAAGKRIVLVAGSQSHGAGAHEFKAGCLL